MTEMCPDRWAVALPTQEDRDLPRLDWDRPTGALAKDMGIAERDLRRWRNTEAGR